MHRYNCYVFICGQEKLTPLHVAACSDSVAVAVLLLNNSANIDAVSAVC